MIPLLILVLLADPLYSPHHIGWLDVDADRKPDRITARVIGIHGPSDYRNLTTKSYDVRIEIRCCGGEITSAGTISDVAKIPEMRGYYYWQKLEKNKKDNLELRVYRREPILLVDETRWYAVVMIGEIWQVVPINEPEFKDPPA